MYAFQTFYYSHLKALPWIGGKLNIKYSFNRKIISNQWSMTRHKHTVSHFFFSNVYWGDSKLVKGQGSNTGHKLDETRNNVKVLRTAQNWRKLAEPTVWIHYWLHTNLSLQVGKADILLNSTNFTEFKYFFSSYAHQICSQTKTNSYFTIFSCK